VVQSKPTPGSRADGARLQKRRRRVALFMLAWTFFVGVALWWLLRGDDGRGGPGAWVMHQGDAARQSLGERARDWFRLADLNFQRIYPWILLGPYVGWLAWYCSLERGRLRLSVPVHLGACALFVWASHAINSRSGMRAARVVIITSLREEQMHPGEVTNSVHVEISKTALGELGEEQMTGGLFMRKSGQRTPPDVLALNPGEYADAGLTNSFPNLAGAFKPPFAPPELPTMRPLTTLLDLFAYGAIVGLAHSVNFYRRYREREHRALLLESNLTKASLSALRAQLQPHFLFNSLNAVVTLLRRDPKLAEATLTSLSELLRLTLSQSDKQEVSLREELEFVERYFEIQQTRFGDRLHFERQIEPGTLDCLVPTLLLQPVIENAIRHGIELAEGAGLVRLSARAEAGKLVLTVEDDGVGLRKGDTALPALKGEDSPSGSWPSGGGDRARDVAVRASTRAQASARERGTGIGLANLRARLEALYGAHQRLELSPRAAGGVTVRIEIPSRAAGTILTPGAMAPKAAAPVPLDNPSPIARRQ